MAFLGLGHQSQKLDPPSHANPYPLALKKSILAALSPKFSKKSRFNFKRSAVKFEISLLAGACLLACMPARLHACMLGCLLACARVCARRLVDNFCPILCTGFRSLLSKGLRSNFATPVDAPSFAATFCQACAAIFQSRLSTNLRSPFPTGLHKPFFALVCPPIFAASSQQVCTAIF